MHVSRFLVYSLKVYIIVKTDTLYKSGDMSPYITLKQKKKKEKKMQRVDH